MSNPHCHLRDWRGVKMKNPNSFCWRQFTVNKPQKRLDKMLQAATEKKKMTPITQRQRFCTTFKNYMCYQVFMSPTECPCGKWECRAQQCVLGYTLRV